MRVEHYTRHADPIGEWVFREISTPDGTLQSHSIGCAVALSDVYYRIELPGQENAPIVS